MNTFEDFLAGIDHPEHQEKLRSILNWIREKYPFLKEEIKWNQPMFVNEGTYIIGFSVAKKHIAVSPEKATMDKFREEIEAKGYGTSAMLIRILWKQEVDYDLLSELIEFQLEDKKGYENFWRQA